MSTMQSVSSSTTRPPRAHDRADLGQGLVVDRRVGQVGGHAAAGRAADLDGLELPPAGHAAADLLDDLRGG